MSHSFIFQLWKSKKAKFLAVFEKSLSKFFRWIGFNLFFQYCHKVFQSYLEVDFTTKRAFKFPIKKYSNWIGHCGSCWNDSHSNYYFKYFNLISMPRAHHSIMAAKKIYFQETAARTFLIKTKFCLINLNRSVKEIKDLFSVFLLLTESTSISRRANYNLYNCN